MGAEIASISLYFDEEGQGGLLAIQVPPLSQYTQFLLVPGGKKKTTKRERERERERQREKETPTHTHTHTHT